jgi:glutathione S-transferase
MRGTLTLAQIMLTCGLGIITRDSGPGWQDGHPKLAAWSTRMLARPSIAATIPPAVR